MASTPTWAVLALGSLFVATAVLGTALGMMVGEDGVAGARLLLAVLNPD